MSHASYSSHSASIIVEGEDWEDYVKGGYHVWIYSCAQTGLGSLFNSLVGEGRQVRLCIDLFSWFILNLSYPRMNRHVALKVVKSAPRYTETHSKISSTSHHFVYSPIPRHSNPTHHSLARHLLPRSFQTWRPKWCSRLHGLSSRFSARICSVW